MDNSLIEKINDIIKHLQHQEVLVLGLQAKVKALTSTVKELSETTGNPNVYAKFDDRFWSEFCSLYQEVPEPSEQLRETYKSLNQISKRTNLE